jgi:rhodanese-related sulfurtransferase
MIASLRLVLLLCVTMSVVGCSGEDLRQTASDIPAFSDISPDMTVGLLRRMAGDPQFVVLDVRTYEEFLAKHIQHAQCMDYYAPDFADSLNELDRDKTYLVYCGTGKRGRATVDMMEEMRFSSAYNVEGGLAALSQNSEGQRLIETCGCP